MKGLRSSIDLQRRLENSGRGLTFVNVSHPEETKQKHKQKHKQKAIRHHVMTRVADSRRKRPRTWTFTLAIPPKSGDEYTGESCNAQDPSTSQLLGVQVPRSLHPYSFFPVDTDPRARQLIQFMIAESDYVYRPFRNEWFSMAVCDSTAFYLSLANAAVFFNQITLKKGSEHSDFEESAKYLGLCLNEITERLENELSNISQGVVVTVLGFLCHDSTVGRWDRFAIHMNGLQNILRLRGDFQRHNSIIPMFASWFDVLESSIFERKPRFPPPCSLNDSILQQGVLSPPLQSLVLRLSRRSYAYGQIATALEASARLAHFVNENAHNSEFWRDAATSAKFMTPIIHLLLSLPRPTECNADSSATPDLLHSELIRLALLMLLARLKQAFSLISEEMPTLGERYSILTRTAPCFDDRFPELALWAHTTAAIVEQARSRKLHVDAISMVMKTLGIQNSGEAIQRAKRLVWIDALMDPGVAALELEVEHARRDFLTPQ